MSNIQPRCHNVQDRWNPINQTVGTSKRVEDYTNELEVQGLSSLRSPSQPPPFSVLVSPYVIDIIFLYHSEIVGTIQEPLTLKFALYILHIVLINTIVILFCHNKLLNDIQQNEFQNQRFLIRRYNSLLNENKTSLTVPSEDQSRVTGTQHGTSENRHSLSDFYVINKSPAHGSIFTSPR